MARRGKFTLATRALRKSRDVSVSGGISIVRVRALSLRWSNDDSKENLELAGRRSSVILVGEDLGIKRGCETSKGKLNDNFDA